MTLHPSLARILSVATTTLALTATAKCQAGLQWLGRYDGTGHSDDQGVVVQVDAHGFVYVAGASAGTTPKTSYDVAETDYVTMKYAPNGQLLWVQRFGAPTVWSEYVQGLAVDEHGSVFVTGGAGKPHSLYADMVTIKYGPDGERLWVARYEGSAGYYGEGCAIVLDGEGGVVVTGNSVEGADDDMSQDIVTVRYDADGRMVWRSRHEGLYQAEDRVHAMARDYEGNYLVTGRVAAAKGSAGSMDCNLATLKYDRDGRLLWARQFDGALSKTDVGYSIAVDSRGNAVVTGTSQGIGISSYGDDSITLAYSPDGELLWAARYDGSAKDWDATWSLAIDREDNAYVAGMSMNINGYSDADYLIIKYDAMGVQRWVTRYGGPSIGEGTDLAQDIAIGPDGSVFVTGSTHGWPVAWTTLRLDASSGAITWEFPFIVPWSNWSFGRAIAVDSNGDLAMTGFAQAPDGANDFDIVTIQVRPEPILFRR